MAAGSRTSSTSNDQTNGGTSTRFSFRPLKSGRLFATPTRTITAGPFSRNVPAAPAFGSVGGGSGPPKRKSPEPGAPAATGSKQTKSASVKAFSGFGAPSCTQNKLSAIGATFGTADSIWFGDPKAPSPPQDVAGCRGRELPSCDLLLGGIGQPTVAATNGRVYVFVGWLESSSDRNGMLKFDPDAKQWSAVRKKDQWPGGLSFYSAWPHKSSIYLVGGICAFDKVVYSLWMFDCDNETFHMMKDSPSVKANPFVAVVGDGKLYAIEAFEESIWAMSLGADQSWEKLADRIGTGGATSAAWIDGSIYMISWPQQLRKYDVRRNMFLRLKQLEGGVFVQRSPLVSSGSLLIAMASRYFHKEASVVIFDTSREALGFAWVEAAEGGCMPPQCLSGIGLACVKGSVYVFGGELPNDKRSSKTWEIELLRAAPPESSSGGDLEKLSSDYARLFSSGEFADAKFLVGPEREVARGHIAILSSRCPKLASFIEEAMKKKKKVEHNDERWCRVEVELPQLEDASTFRLVLQFVYAGRVVRGEGHDVHSEMRLFNAAAFFGLEGLERQSAAELKNATGVGDFVERLLTASTFKLGFARRFFIDEVARHELYGEIVSSPKFCRLGAQLVHEVLLQFGRMHGED